MLLFGSHHYFPFDFYQCAEIDKIDHVSFFHQLTSPLQIPSAFLSPASLYGCRANLTSMPVICHPEICYCWLTSHGKPTLAYPQGLHSLAAVHADVLPAVAWLKVDVPAYQQLVTFLSQ